MTMFVARFDSNKGIVTFANAGHQFPFLLPRRGDDPRTGARTRPSRRRQKSPAVMLIASGNMLGLGDGPAFQENKVEIRPGDHFVFYTDGVIECLSEEGKALGQQDFISLTSSLVDHDTVPLAEVLIGRLRQLFGRREQLDDYTLVVLEVPSTWKARETAAPDGVNPSTKPT